MKESNDIVLTCNVQYAYPLPTIEWYIMTSLSDDYTLMQNSSTNYVLYNNGSIELLHRFLFEMGHIKVKCLATNIYGSNNSNFDLWEYEIFMRSKFSYVHHNYVIKTLIEQEFKVYIDNITNCEDLNKVQLLGYHIKGMHKILSPLEQNIVQRVGRLHARMV